MREHPYECISLKDKKDGPIYKNQRTILLEDKILKESFILLMEHTTLINIEFLKNTKNSYH